MTENGSINERRVLNVNQHLFKNGFDLNMGRVCKSNKHLIFISAEKKIGIKIIVLLPFLGVYWNFIQTVHTLRCGPCQNV